MQNTAPNLCTHVTQDSNTSIGDLSDRPAKKPYIRTRFYKLDDVVQKTKVTDYTDLGQSVCSVNGS